MADFNCNRARLVIELDGGIHDKKEQREKDYNRDQIINSLELRAGTHWSAILVRFFDEEFVTIFNWIVIIFLSLFNLQESCLLRIEVAMYKKRDQ